MIPAEFVPASLESAMPEGLTAEQHGASSTVLCQQQISMLHASMLLVSCTRCASYRHQTPSLGVTFALQCHMCVRPETVWHICSSQVFQVAKKIDGVLQHAQTLRNRVRLLHFHARTSTVQATGDIAPRGTILFDK